MAGNWKRKTKDRTKPPLSEFFLSKSKTARIQELRIRNDFNGTRASVEKGLYTSKGIQRADVLDKTFMFEAKQTDKKSFALSRKVLAKIDSEATNHGRIPAVIIQFKSFPFSIEREWAVIPYSYLRSLIKKLRGETGE